MTIKRLHHSQVANTQHRFLCRRDGTRRRQHRVHDDDASARFDCGDEVFEDQGRFCRGPVVDDHAEQINVCVLDWLRGEEVVPLEGDAGGDCRRERGQVRLGAAEGVGEILHDELEVGEGVGEGNAGVAAGTADLNLICKYGLDGWEEERDERLRWLPLQEKPSRNRSKDVLR